MRSLLAVVCPPLAVLAASGTRTQTVASAGLTLFGYVPGVIHALGVVEQYRLERRYESVMRAMDHLAA